MRHRLSVLVIPVAAAASLLSFSVQAKEKPMKISSPAFAENSKIPAVYTCDGQDKSPPLTIEGVSPNAKSLALIMDDPDAPGGTWVHWILWNIDAGTREVPAASMPKDARSGMTDFGKNGYGGPCPPSGSHRYFFKIYALDTVLDLSEKSVKADLEKAMKGHIIGQAELIGRYR